MAIDVTVSGLNTVVDVEFAESPSDIPAETYIALRGEKGDKGDTGAAGQDGADGFSPIATVSKVGDTATISITDENGTTTATVTDGTDGVDGQDGADGQDGFSPSATVSKVGDTATITITDKDGTTTANISDGTDGVDGTDGADGYSPTATVTKSGDTATITITDINGTTTATVKDGMQANVFVAEFNVTTYADVKDAYDNDAILICTVDDSGNTMTLQLVYFDVANEIFYFAFPTSDGWYLTHLSNADGWGDEQFYFASTDVATQLADGLMSALDKQKLDGLSKRNIWYGTCSTSASSSPKSITTASGDFELTAGSMLVVLFSHANSLSSASLQVDGGTAKAAYPMDGTSDISNRWGSNELVMFAYDGTKFIMLEQGKASTTAYGITKLNNTVTSTSTSEAATANAVKSAYDNGGVQSVNGNTGAVSLSIHNVPSGGSSGQVLSKASGTDYDLAWTTPSSGSVTDVTVDGVSVVTGGVASVDLTGKQDELVSGTNIRTINGTSLLGNGDISVAAGGTPIPTADTVAEFDGDAHINSEDMSSQDVEDFLADINAQGTPSEYRKLLWTNTQGGQSSYTITADFSEYDEIEIVFDRNGDLITKRMGNSGSAIFRIVWANYIAERTATISSNTMTIGNGSYYGSYNSGSATTGAAYAVPSRIYGIKYDKVAPIQVNASDYVIEQGASGSWTYRKWDSGIYECWTRTANSSAVTIYFPITFVEVPRILATSGSTAAASTYGADDVFTRGTTVSKTDISFQSNVTNTNIWADVYVIGKWK